MQRDEVICLSPAARALDDPFPFILECARGKRVLNVGASGGIESYLPGNRSAWLHQRLAGVAAEVIGIDVDAESVAFAASHGVELLVDDCETCRFERPFDLVVMSDVIEHVDAPLRAVGNLARQLAPGGRLLITTPNPTHYGLVLRAWLGRPTAVYYDHVGMFLPEHFQAICNRLGLRLSDVVFFSHLDARSFSLRCKSSLARGLGRVFPRCHGAFLVIVEAGGGA